MSARAIGVGYVVDQDRYVIVFRPSQLADAIEHIQQWKRNRDLNMDFETADGMIQLAESDARWAESQ